MIENIFNQAGIIIGFLLSLALEYLPGVAQQYQKLSEWQKRAVILALCAITTATVLVITCSQDAAACPADWQDGLITFILSLVTSQGTHQLTKRG